VKYDVVIVGGGIVGLATGLKISIKNPKLKLLVLEKESELSAHQTGNNSGVIHSGIYYTPGSLKAKNCTEGYQQLIQYCQEHDIKYELYGKVIVATRKEELPKLETLFERGQQNGLRGLRKLEKDEIKEIEPHVIGLKGIWVPQTGIIDFKEVAQSYGASIEQNGQRIQLGEKVIGIKKNERHSVVETEKGAYSTRVIVNCAGLYSDKIALINQKNLNVRIIPFRGEYYKLAEDKKYLVKNLIYPVPDPSFPFLGVHFTRMIHGGVEAGPNAVLAFAREGYKKSKINIPELMEVLTWPGFVKVAQKYWQTGMGEMVRSYSKTAFTHALQKLIPEIEKKDLVSGGAGVRAQACDRDGGLLDDFLIIEQDHAVHVLNAPSPAATSSLAIGDTVSNRVLKRFE